MSPSHSGVSPIGRLPIELLTEVFLLSRPACPMSLCHTCRRWRSIVWQTPGLWSYIRLNLDSAFCAQKAEHWVGQARSTLLNIRIVTRQRYLFGGVAEAEEDEVRYARIDRVVEKLRGSLGRWQSFKIHAPVEDITRFFHGCAGSTPRLKAISVAVTQDVAEAMPEISIPFDVTLNPEFQSSLQLSAENCIPNILPSLRTTITQLTMKIDTRLQEADQILDVLEGCTQLQTLHIYGLQNCSRPIDIMTPEDDRTVLLPNLVELCVYNVHDLIDVLGILSIPSIRIFHLMGFHWCQDLMDVVTRILQTSTGLSSVSLIGHDCDIHNYSDFASFVQTNEVINLPVLGTLEVLGGGIDAIPLIRRMKLPQISVLRFSGQVDNEFLSFLSSLPRLRILELVDRDAGNSPRTIQPLLEILRFPAIESLRVVVESSDGFRILDNLAMPSIKVLRVDVDIDRIPTDSDQGIQGMVILPADMIIAAGRFLRGLIDRSRAPLTTLILKNVNVSEDDVGWCLDRVRASLKRFLICRCPISDVTLDSLNVGLSQSRSLDSANSSSSSSSGSSSHLKEIYVRESLITPQGLIHFLRLRNTDADAGTDSILGPSGSPSLRGIVVFPASDVSESEVETINVSKPVNERNYI